MAPGQMFTDFFAHANADDTYSNGNRGDQTRGTFTITGEYGLVDGPIPDPPFKQLGGPSGFLPATLIDPTGDLDWNFRMPHSIDTKWDCCDECQ